MPGKNFIFDMDGVLVDSEPLYMRMNQELFRRLGMDVSQEYHLSFVGTSTRDMWQIFKDQFLLPQTLNELVAMDERQRVEKLSALTQMDPIEGIPELLKAIRQTGARVGLASSSSPTVIHTILERSGLQSQFDVVVSGNQVQSGKPAPDIFLKTATDLGCESGDCNVIEDSPHGVAGAAAAGMYTIGFQNLNSGNQDLSRANMLVRDFSAATRDAILTLLTS